MNEDAMWRYIYEKPEYTVYFGKSCVGKSTYLNKIAQYSCKFVDCDKLIWTVLEQYTDKDNAQRYKDQSFETVYSNVHSLEQKEHILNNWCKVLFTDQFWNYFFEIVENSFVDFDADVSYDTILDWAAVGFYYKYIPIKYRSKMEFIELTCDESVRVERINKKNFNNKIKYLVELYKKPLIIDKTINITNQ